MRKFPLRSKPAAQLKQLRGCRRDVRNLCPTLPQLLDFAARMHHSLAQQSQTGVPDLVVPHRKIHQRWLVPENSTNLRAAIAGYATVLQAAGKSTVGIAAPDPLIDTPQYPSSDWEGSMGWFLAANQCSSARHCYILQGSEKIQVSKMGLWVRRHTAPAFHKAAGHFDSAIHVH